MTIRNLLIANRGEIALRVMRTARARGHITTAVYSDADRDAPHVHAADRAIHLGPGPLSESYLHVERIIEAARRAGADAIHPGYGMLSEAPRFAHACRDAGLVFVGPSPESIELLADKAQARRVAERSGVPCVPGYDGDAQDIATLRAEAARIGFPVMVKAAAGGGGRGMRRVETDAELEDAVSRAAAEARAAFGDGRLLLEKLVEPARHVEIQIVADTHGRAVHLQERDCSVQRRFQKIIEEAPSPAVDARLRERMGDAALVLTRACRYHGVGTVELLLDDAGHFYFLEMNTRLQVEHGVTELITGLDLVELQLRVADGEALDLRQEDVRHHGHAIEARLYAEDPSHGFLPQAGRVLRWRAPMDREGVRVDHALRDGLEVGTLYDPMLGKVLAHGTSRADALRRLQAALSETCLLGVGSNRDFLRTVLDHPVMRQGHADTSFLAQHGEACAAEVEPTAEDLAVSAIACMLAGDPRRRDFGETTGWTNALGLAWPITLEHAGRAHALRVAPATDRGYCIYAGEQQAITIEAVRYEPATGRLSTLCDGMRRNDFVAVQEDVLWLDTGRGVFRMRDRSYPSDQGQAEDEGTGRIVSPMEGTVVELRVSEGDAVERGEPLLVLEAMKLQHVISAGVAGRVDRIHARAGTPIAVGAPLIEIDPGAAHPCDPPVGD